MARRQALGTSQLEYLQEFSPAPPFALFQLSRFFLISGFLLGIVAIFVATVAFLAYGYTPKRAGELQVAGLEETAEIGWDNHGIPWIQANSEVDAAASLGYVHAVDHTESMVLWRQAALGELNAWEGAGAIQLDLFARKLGFERLAREAYQNLDDRDQRRLEAYVAGVNRALETSGVRQKEAFIRQRIEPVPWETWHPLAVERLFAYLATSPLRHDSTFQAVARRDSVVSKFVETDSLFRSTLGVWGLQHGRAYGTREGIVLHQPLGNTALPVFSESVVHIGNQKIVLGTIPGTLMTPFGSKDGRSWGIVLSGRTALVAAGDSIPPPTFERLVAANGDETLIRLIRDESGLILNRRWRFVWRGFQASSDAGAWRTIGESGSQLPTFSLIRGAGVLHGGDGTQVSGAPHVGEATSGRAFASEHPTASSAAQRFRTLQNASISELARDTESPWAASVISPLLTSLSSDGTSAASGPQGFIRGWNHKYAINDVSPALFEYWLKAIDDVLGGVHPDSMLTDWRLPMTLRLGTAMMKDAIGDSEADWRWQETFTDQLTPPFDNTNWACRPYAIQEGHPTSLLPGPSHYLEDPPGPSVWSSWLSSGTSRDDSTGELTWSIRRPVCAREVPYSTPVQTISLQVPPETSLRLVPERQ